MIAAIRSLAFTLFFLGLTILCVVSAAIAGLRSPRVMQFVVRRWATGHRWGCRWLLGQHIRIEGTIPDQTAWVVSKHESMFETIDMLCLFPNAVIAAKKQLLDIPGWGWIARRYGLIEVDREAGAKALRKMQKAAAQAIGQGRTVILFPEGTRVAHGAREPLRAGFAAFYQLLNQPVLPIAIDSGTVSPRKSFIKRPGTITYRIGALIPAGLPRKEAENLAYEAINSLNPPAGHGLATFP